jgi:hypothetical protein
MWTCPKCGEAIEDQFDSCRTCSNVPREPATTARPPLKLSDYLIAALIAYLIPFLAIFLQPRFADLYTVSWGREILHDPRALFLMLVPAFINFVILLPFLKSPGSSRVAAVLLLFAWIWFLLSTSAKIK